jgi:hypothetical protein
VDFSSPEPSVERPVDRRRSANLNHTDRAERARVAIGTGRDSSSAAISAARRRCLMRSRVARLAHAATAV